ncbi:uncharacterized protein BJX67DRAFT_348961 [Aspergillus lucknowensis]|uniref:Uncharacterized protein n=1 Tax=Aspergillus lucknowensis TaxID=176173 RepID=A0ABR4LZG0_9EURO
MSTITRAFTKRNKRIEVSAPMPYREGQVKFSSGTIKRGKISAPVELLSTTNMLAYNAPDLHSHSASSSSTSSLQSPDESDLPFNQRAYPSPLTTPDDSPVEPNPLSGYFPKRSATVTSHPRASTSTTSSTDAPMVPKRALSHTKRTHQELARQRSLSRMSPPPLHANRSNPQARPAYDNYNTEPHPFGKELEQVNEVVEEFGGAPLFDEEERILHHKGLKKYSVDDYLVEIEDLYGSIFNDRLGPIASTSWL